MPKRGIIVDPGKEVDPPIKVDELKQSRKLLAQLKQDIDKIDKLLAKVQTRTVAPPKPKPVKKP